MDQSEIPTCTVYRLRLAARAATRVYDGHLAPAGISISQFGLLRIVAAGDGASVTDLARRMGLDRTTLTRNLAPLVRSGHLSLAQGADKRTRAIAITDKGREALVVAKPMWKAAQLDLQATLGAAVYAELHMALGHAIPKLG